MVDKARKSLIGMFVVGALVLLVGAVFILSPTLFSRDKFYFVCHFSDSLKGLSEGSPVYLLGVPVGQVETVKIGDPLNLTSYVAPVIISLEKDKIFSQHDKTFFDQDDANEVIESYIEKGLVAQIESQSLLTGRLAIELSFRNNHVGTQPEFQDDFLQIPTTLERLSEVWEKISEVPFAEMGKDVREILDGVNTVIHSLETIIVQVNIPQLSNQISELMISLTSTSNNLNTMIQSNEKGVKNVLDSLNALSRNSNEFVKNLNTTTSSDSVLIVQLSETLKALEAASKAVAEIASLLEIKPDALIFGK